LWTHFVTPHADQTQHDQTIHFSYYKKAQSEQLHYIQCMSGLVGLCTLTGG
jgi:hypothetical protein